MNFQLGGDIDLNDLVAESATFNMIGSRAVPFTGVFDGNSYVISNLNINDPTQYGTYIGFIRYLDASGLVENLGLDNASVVGNMDMYVGGMVGGMNNGSITNSYASSTVAGYMGAGGLVGYMNNGAITSSYANSTVTCSDMYAGGLVGINNYGAITTSYANTTVTGPFGAGILGGLVGSNYTGPITNSHATGTVTGDLADLGGLVGQNVGPITNSYANCTVTAPYGDGTGAIGGLVGEPRHYYGLIRCWCGNR